MVNKIYTHVVLPVKRVEATGDWRTLQNNELYDLYSLSVVQVIKTTRCKLLHPRCVTGYGTVARRSWTTLPTVMMCPETSIFLEP
jgi:hypothetical protein